MMLFGMVGMVGVVGAASMTVMKGPVKTMAEVTKRTVAENNMIATGKLALIASTSLQNADCDLDLTVEPIPFGASISGFTGGGAVPARIGTAKEDPWGSAYGYCVWDHGSFVDSGGCNGENRLAGGDVSSEIVLAIISAGPDSVWQTTCQDFVDANSDDVADTPLVDKTSGSDDLVMGYTYNEASAMAGGVWNIDSGDPNKAEIQKNISVKGNDDIERFAFDADVGNLTIGGAGSFSSLKTDFLSALTGGGNISILSPLSSTANITTSADVSANDVSASGDVTATGNVTTGAGTISGAALASSGNVTAIGDVATAAGAISGAALISSGTLDVNGISTLGVVNSLSINSNTFSASGDVVMMAIPQCSKLGTNSTGIIYCNNVYGWISGSWGACSLSCGGGTQSRSVNCKRDDGLVVLDSFCLPTPKPAVSQNCNTHNCPIDGGWSAWSGWSGCSASCGGGTRSRTRSCNNPVPQYGGANCSGSSSGSTSCNTQSCGGEQSCCYGENWGTSCCPYSDIRLKDIQGDYKKGLEDISKLRPIIFNYKKDNPRNLSSKKNHIGFVAQEVQEIFPEAVHEDEGGYLAIDPSAINVSLVNAVKELRINIEIMRAKNKYLEDMIGQIQGGWSNHDGVSDIDNPSDLEGGISRKQILPTE